MQRRKGFLLLTVVIFITVLALSSMVSVFDQETFLKRFHEEELKQNIAAIRGGIDLYRYKYSISNPDPLKIATLENALHSGPVADITDLLASESLLRARAATGTMQWGLVTNQIKNPSFEIDTGTDYGAIGSWHGNFSANDNVPDGWQLLSQGAEQVLPLDEAATYVVSAWINCVSTTAKAKLQIWADSTLPLCEFTADQSGWKRYFMSFSLNSPGDIRLTLEQTGLTSGDIAYIDGVMIEKWNPPASVPAIATPVASVWTASSTVVSRKAVEVLQQRQFADLISKDADPATFSWWFQW